MENTKAEISVGRMEKVIYMPLLGEGTECWRPVRAVGITEDVFKVIDDIPSNESWKFAPFSRVRCRSRTFTGGEPGLEAFEYAIESDPNYRLLRKHEKEVFRVVFTNGEESVVRVMHVDGEHEDFIYDLLSTNSERDHYRNRGEAACLAKFADLVSAQLET
jgi:hypothetical protein